MDKQTAVDLELTARGFGVVAVAYESAQFGSWLRLGQHDVNEAEHAEAVVGEAIEAAVRYYAKRDKHLAEMGWGA